MHDKHICDTKGLCVVAALQNLHQNNLFSHIYTIVALWYNTEVYAKLHIILLSCLVQSLFSAAVQMFIHAL